MAVPSEEPRLEMLRDSPEISPCRLLAEARLHDVHRWREHQADAQAEEQQPGDEGEDSGAFADQRQQQSDADQGDDEAGADERALGVALGQPFGGE